MICSKCKDIKKGIILSDKVFMKEISILWNNTNRRGQLISIIKEYFGEERGHKIINTIKRIS